MGMPDRMSGRGGPGAVAAAVVVVVGIGFHLDFILF
jgi:hypothetical protein